MRRFLLLALPLALLASAAHAQEDTSALSERLDRLERDVNFVQKQVYRSNGGETGASGGAGNNGQLQVRFSQIDEELRQIRGLIEQTQFQNKQTATELKKFSEDVDYRLRSIEQKQAQQDAAAAQAAQAAAVEPAPEAPASAEAEKVAS
jgi:TolA-binding protein